MDESAASGLPALPAASLDVHDRIWHSRDDLKRVLSWGIWTSVWLLSLGGLAVAFLWFHAYLTYQATALLDLIVGGVFFVTWSVRTLWISVRARRRLLDWEDAILPFLYRVKFELLPYVGTDRARDIWERYKSVYQDLSEIESKSLAARINLRLGRSELKFGSVIKGKKEKHTFDIYGATFGQRTLFVRRFDQETQVTQDQLERFKGEVEDRLKRVEEHICVVGAFSRAGFGPDAISYVEDEKNRVDESYPIDLIRETDTGYAVVFVDSD